MREAASAVAMNVLAGTMTSPPGPTPAARSASSRASVPLATPMQWSTPMNSAYFCSKSATAGPSTKAVAAKTEASPDSTSAAISACWDARSTNGTLIGVALMP